MELSFVLTLLLFISGHVQADQIFDDECPEVVAVTSSSQTSIWKPENILNDEHHTFWMSAVNSGNPEFVQIEMSEAVVATSVEIRLNNGRQGSSPQIQGSNDAYSWDTIASFNAYSWPVDSQNFRMGVVQLAPTQAYKFYRYHSDSTVYILLNHMMFEFQCSPAPEYHWVTQEKCVYENNVENDFYSSLVGPYDEPKKTAEDCKAVCDDDSNCGAYFYYDCTNCLVCMFYSHDVWENLPLKYCEGDRKFEAKVIGADLPTCVCHDSYDWTSFGVVCETHCMSTESNGAYCHPGNGDSMEACGRTECWDGATRCQKPELNSAACPATTEIVASSSLGSWEANNIEDETHSTYWLSAINSGNPEWITLKLAQAAFVGSVEIRLNNGRQGSSPKFQGSNDNVNWEDLASINSFEWQNDSQNFRHGEIELNPTKAYKFYRYYSGPTVYVLLNHITLTCVAPEARRNLREYSVDDIPSQNGPARPSNARKL